MEASYKLRNATAPGAFGLGSTDRKSSHVRFAAVQTVRLTTAITGSCDLHHSHTQRAGTLFIESTKKKWVQVPCIAYSSNLGMVSSYM